MVDDQTAYQTAQLVLVEELRTALADFDQHEKDRRAAEQDSRLAEQHVLQLLKDIARMPSPLSPQDVEAVRASQGCRVFKYSGPLEGNATISGSLTANDGRNSTITYAENPTTLTTGGQVVKTEVRCPEWKTP